MNRIVTRGFGPSHLVVTRGYGAVSVGPFFKRILRLCSCIGREMNLVSKWKTNCA